ncbi:MAG: digeranylgeranylglycerophospholipid reductase [Halanaeroarchaeum sp.]
MSDRYDVVVAGAGPAGAQTARDLAQRDYDVLVLEAEAEATFPRQSNKSTGGTFPGMLGSFGIPDDVVMHFTDSVVLESPTDHFTQHGPGAVLEFADFKRFLVEDGRDHGAEYWFDARVAKPITEDGQVVGVRYNGDQEVYADIVVDATGPAAPLAKDLGVVDLEREKQAIGIEWEMEGVELDHPDYGDLRDAMMLRLDHRYAPGGYAWVFHTGEDTAKVGLCYIQNETYHKEGDNTTIDQYLEQWLDEDPRFADAEKIEGKQHRGSAHVQAPGSMSTGGFMAVGDTVPSIDPLWGEGIHKGMKSGRAAAVTADHCLTGETDTSAEEMALYEELWHRDVAPQATLRLLMTHLLYYAPNERYDQFMADMRALDEETLAAANEGKILALANLFHAGDVPMLARFVRDHRDVVGRAVSDLLPF